MTKFTSIVITGASSGIGEALAIDYAAPGTALALNGRDAGRLRQVAEKCRAKGATVDASVINVTDRAAMAAWLSGFDDRHPVDLVVANAGISIDIDCPALADFAAVRTTMAVNFDGVLNTLEPLMGRLMSRKAGQIALMSSLAGFVGLPYAAAYNASKAALRVWGESLRPSLGSHGIGVSVVCPGFVVSRITARWPFAMPFLMSAGRASAIVRRGLARNQARIAFPVATRAGLWFAMLWPAAWTARLTALSAHR